MYDRWHAIRTQETLLPKQKPSMVIDELSNAMYPSIHLSIHIIERNKQVAVAQIEKVERQNRTQCQGIMKRG